MKSTKPQFMYNVLGCFLMVLAFLLFFYPRRLIILAAQLVAIGLISYAIIWLYRRWRTSRHFRILDQRWSHYLIPVACLVGAILLMMGRAYSPLVLTLMIGIYQLIVGLIGLYSYSLLIRDHVYYHWSQLLNVIIHLVFGCWSLLAMDRVQDTMWRLAIYLGLLGGNFIFDGWLQQSRHLISIHNRRIRIPMPTLVTSLLPYRMMTFVNRLVTETDKQAHPFEFPEETDSKVNVEIFIHSSPFGFDRIGHIDIIYRNQVYAFGNFDAETRRCFQLVGDGVMFTSQRDDYLRFLMRRQVTVMSFGLSLSSQELSDLDKAIQRLLKQTQPFEMTTERQMKGYIGALIHLAHPKFYKFKQGPFQTYFVFGTNCVTFVDDLIWKSGVDIFAFAGIMTPGAYLDYLNKAYVTPNSKVVSRRVYHRRLFKM